MNFWSFTFTTILSNIIESIVKQHSEKEGDKYIRDNYNKFLDLTLLSFVHPAFLESLDVITRSAHTPTHVHWDRERRVSGDCY